MLKRTCTKQKYNVGKLLIEELLPWSEKIPDEIHIHKKDLEKRTD